MEFFLQRDNNEPKAIEYTPLPNLAAVQRDVPRVPELMSNSRNGFTQISKLKPSTSGMRPKI